MDLVKMWNDLVDQLVVEIQNCNDLLDIEELSEERVIELNAFITAYDNVLTYIQILEENENDERI